jgi:hypothetical protein
MMKFRIRHGFNLFHSMDEAIDFGIMGAHCGAVPRAKGGDIVSLKPVEVAEHYRLGQLGMLEPLDAEAIKAYGSTVPIISRQEIRERNSFRPALGASN